MFGGGESHFAPPAPIDKDTLFRFAEFCTALKQSEKATTKTIEKLIKLAVNVGSSMTAKELVTGVVLRGIKTWRADKLWLAWCLLDRLSKEHPEDFGLQFQKYILEVGSEYIPWEDEVPEKPRYQVLVESWDTVFPNHVISAIYASKKERLYNVKHPEEYQQALDEEERIWKQEEAKHQDEDGLDDFSEPCLQYLQGNCPWGENCTQLHPEGLEGSLPPECRSGDWRCPSCGTINRHFRRRCVTCPKEKPQYKRHAEKSAEEALLTHPDLEAMRVFKLQFGYDPCDGDEAIQFWRSRGITSDEPDRDRDRERAGNGIGLSDSAERWITERKAAIKTKILNKPASNEYEEMIAARIHWPGTEEWSQLLDQALKEDEEGGRSKKRRALELKVTLPTVPTMPARDKVFYIAQRVVDNGVQHSDSPGYLFLLCQSLQEAVQDPAFKSAPTIQAPLAFVNCVKLVFTGWSTAGRPANHPAVPFCQDIKNYLPYMPLQSNQKEEVLGYCNIVLSGSK